eukprot:CAMPEP_0201564230 /NCGR_PEP_ID=MMETSP0190_2-20130828/2282_1 /ASSEMBLY_ACC=CAM_ASM_000263 /TAXON_ID=37353 /ORGANISM="Rosalina sp." /LENGTH=337 /DNA_ID=CAMNT_0047980097 /DNA_START=137 /DNA_END=1150 /DNA_ORIENTATION=+
MPVRTRSQRLAEEGSDSNGSAPVITQSVPRKSTRKQRASRRSARLAKKEGDEPQEPPKPAYPTEEAKSEEIPESTYEPTITRPQTAPATTEIYEDEDGQFDEDDEDLEQEEINPYKSNVEDLRRYVQDYLETPDRPQVPHRSRIHNVIEPSPRIDSITLNNKRSKIEFLVPPRNQDEPMEIRQQVRNLLSPDNVPVTTQQLSVPSEGVRAPSRSPSLPYDEMSKYGDKLRQDKTTRLWSPYAPSFDKEQGDRTARLMMTLMLVIALAVFIKVYQTEIITFLKPLVDQLRQLVMGQINKAFQAGSEDASEEPQEENTNTEEANLDEQVQAEEDTSVTR